MRQVQQMTQQQKPLYCLANSPAKMDLAYQQELGVETRDFYNNFYPGPEDYVRSKRLILVSH